ncbi:MAG: hypothetical protein AAF171_26955 [Cyanobacteria bacterium P01_A01_bin.116]
MDYYTATDKLILLGVGFGLALGLLLSSQEIALDWQLKKKWLGWDAAISQSVVSAIVCALVVSAIAFLTLLYAPAKPLADIRTAMIRGCLAIGLLLPAARRAGLSALQLVGRLLTPDQGGE